MSVEPPGEPPVRQGIQSAEIAMTVLLALEECAAPASLTQLAAMSGMQPSKIHRYLVSLSRVGLVLQSPGSSLDDFGPAMRRLGAEALRRMDEAELASEYLPSLRDRTRYAVNLATIRAAIIAALKEADFLHVPEGRRDHTTPAEALRLHGLD